MHLTKAYMAEMPCNQLWIDSAMYLLTISLPSIYNVAMSPFANINPWGTIFTMVQSAIHGEYATDVLWTDLLYYKC